MSAKRKARTLPDDRPVLLGVRHGKGQIKVRCSHCGRDHFHGWPEGTPEDAIEHRVGHCAGDDPATKDYRRAGYYIGLENPERAAA